MWKITTTEVRLDDGKLANSSVMQTGVPVILPANGPIAIEFLLPQHLGETQNHAQ